MHIFHKDHFARAFGLIFFVLLMSQVFSQNYTYETEGESQGAELDLHENTNKIQKELCIIQSPGQLNLDPQLSSYADEAQILNGLYEGLFSYDPLSLDPVPALASSYKISRDKKTWTFTIRKDAKFSNGDSITAQSVYNSWIALINPQKNAPFASLLDCIEGAQEYRLGQKEMPLGIEVKDLYTLVVKLKYPTEHFAKILCHHAFSVIHEKNTVQSGPFFLQQLSKNELVIAKNSFYWDKDAVALPSIRFLFSDDEDENTYLFNMGEVHWLTDSYTTSKLINDDSLVFGTLFGTEYYFFKIQEGTWDNPKAREALLLAIDWEKLRELYYQPATTLLARLYGYPQIYGLEESDTDEARSIIESLELREEEKHIHVFVPDTEYHERQVDILAESWEKIGISVEISKVPNLQYYTAVSQKKADLFTYTWIGDFADPMAFLELFKAGSSLNESNWSNPKFESLLEEATTTNDSKKRYEKLAEAEQELLDNFVVIPLSHPVSVNIIDKDVLGGWFENALNLHPLKNLYFKESQAIKNLLIAKEAL